MPLFIVMAGADMFSGEISDRTIKITLLKPISRFKVYMSKILALSAYILGTLIMVFIVTNIAALFLGNAGNLLGNAIVFFAALLPMLLIAFYVGLISQFFKSGSGVMVFSILFFIASEVLSVLYPKVADFLMPAYLNWHTLFSGYSFAGPRILTLFMFMVSNSIINLTTGYYLF